MFCLLAARPGPPPAADPARRSRNHRSRRTAWPRSDRWAVGPSIFVPSDERPDRSAEPREETVADPQRVGDGRQGRVDRADAREEARVDDVEIVQVVGLAVDVQRGGSRVGSETDGARLMRRRADRHALVQVDAAGQQPVFMHALMADRHDPLRCRMGQCTPRVRLALRYAASRSRMWNTRELALAHARAGRTRTGPRHGESHGVSPHRRTWVSPGSRTVRSVPLRSASAGQDMGSTATPRRLRSGSASVSPVYTWT